LRTTGDRENSRKEQMTNVIGLIILLTLGLIFLYVFYRLDNSETVANYLDVGSGNLRFIAFIGILKYGILIVGTALTIMTPIFLIKKMKTPHNNT
jgi:hypothetical protein